MPQAQNHSLMHRVADLEHKVQLQVQDQSKLQETLIKALSVKTSITLDALGLGLQKDAVYIQSLENAETCVASKNQVKTHAVTKLRSSSDSTEASTADAAEVEQYGVMERLAVNVIEKVTEITQLRADLEEEIRSRCYHDAQIIARNVTELEEIRAWSVKEHGRLQAEWQATETIRHDDQKKAWHEHCIKMQATVDCVSAYVFAND